MRILRLMAFEIKNETNPAYDACADMADSEPDTNNRKKRRRASLDINTKVEIIHAIERGEKQVLVASRYSIAQNTVSNIYASRAKLLKEWEDGSGSKKSLKSAKNPQLEAALRDWLAQQRLNNVPVSASAFQEKAKQLASSLNIGNFRASSGYVDKFKRRHGIVFKMAEHTSSTTGKSSSSPHLHTLGPFRQPAQRQHQLQHPVEVEESRECGEPAEAQLGERLVTFAEAYLAMQIVMKYCEQHGLNSGRLYNYTDSTTHVKCHIQYPDDANQSQYDSN